MTGLPHNNALNQMRLEEDALALIAWAEKYESTPLNMLTLATVSDKEMSPMLALKTGISFARLWLEEQGRTA